MSNQDEKLRRDLTDAFDDDDPGADFDQRVMADIEGGGGEHEISALDLSPRRSRKWILWVGVAAASILLMVYFGSRRIPIDISGPNAAGGDGEEAVPAPAETIELPVCLSTGKFKPELHIYVTKDEKVIVDGKVLNWSGLTKALRAFLKDKKSTGPLKTFGNGVLICGDRRVRWRVIQWVMQWCAAPDVRLWNLAIQVEAEAGRATLPVPLPKGRGLTLPGDQNHGLAGLADRLESPPPPVLTVTLQRKKGEAHTRVKLLGSEIGVDEQGLEVLRQRAAQIVRNIPEISGEVNALAWVPFADVVRAVDCLRQAGCDRITFVGAPPTNVMRETVVQTVVASVRLRLRDGKPEIATRHDGEFEPLSTGLEKLTKRLRILKAEGHSIAANIYSGGVPDSVVQRVMEVYRKEGVTSIKQRK